MVNDYSNVTITIKISPEDVRGEAILVINGVESKIFLKDEITNVTLHYTYAPATALTWIKFSYRI